MIGGLLVACIAIAAAIAVGSIAASAYYSSEKARMRRLFTKVKRLEIALVPDGTLVSLVGKVTYDGEPLISPLSERPCTYYEVHVTEGGGRGFGKSVARESKGRDFLLRDGTGKAFVKLGSTAPGLCQVVLHMDTDFKSGIFRDATPKLEAFLKSQGQSSRRSPLNRDLTYVEGIIEAGKEVVVAGQARWETDPDPEPGAAAGSYREAPRRLVLGAVPGIGLCVTNDVDLLAGAKQAKMTE